MLKIQALSDMHGDLIDVPKCDVVCICGDFSPLLIQRDYTQMMKWVFSDFISWLIKLNCKKVLIVPGNHDFFFEKMMNKQVYDIIEKGTDNKVKFLIDEEYTYKNVKFYGTPMCESIFGNWAYCDSVIARKSYENIPFGTDILLTHEAPYNSCGKIDNENRFGSFILLDQVRTKSPKYHIFGHIHDGNRMEIDGNTTFVNVSIKDDSYKTVRKSVEILYDNE